MRRLEREVKEEINGSDRQLRSSVELIVFVLLEAPLSACADLFRFKSISALSQSYIKWFIFLLCVFSRWWLYYPLKHNASACCWFDPVAWS